MANADFKGRETPREQRDERDDAPYVMAVDDAPRMGRVGRAVYVAFVLALTVSLVWVVGRSLDQAIRGSPPDQGSGIGDQGSGRDQGSGIGGRRSGTGIQPPGVTSAERAAIVVEEPSPILLPETASEAPRLEQGSGIGDQGSGIRDQGAGIGGRRSGAGIQPPGVPSAERAAIVVEKPAPIAQPQPAVEAPASNDLPRVAIEEPPLVLPPAAPLAAAARPEPATPAGGNTGSPPNAASPPAADATAGGALNVLDAERAIRAALSRYRSAFNALDAQAARQVWPTVNQRMLDRAFEQLEEQTVSFDGCAIEINGVLATAACSGTARFVPRVGSRSEQVQSRQWSFMLRRAYSGEWLIQQVDAR